jgi:hypothetical protein
LRTSPSLTALILYSIGDPTDEEQLFVEYINRARANPGAEAERLKASDDPVVLQNYQFFGVDVDAMRAAVSALDPAPPLSLNAELLTAARLHSQDMLRYQYQGHYETNNDRILSPGDRIKAQGYDWSRLGENVFAHAKSVFHGHAALEVDWGPGPGGMQNPPGHRENIHDPAYREVGIGLAYGSTGPVGPMLVTQDFASALEETPFITGVAYYDLNSNKFYDPGEGLGGVSVTVSGSSHHALTANSGGYSVPIPGSGDYTVTFSALGLTPEQVTVNITGARNAKVDFVPLYSPPVISGPDVALTSQNNPYHFTAVGAATAYQWLVSGSVASTTVEGAENGLADVTAQTSGEYPVVVAGVAASGNNAFHLAQPEPERQTLTWNRTFQIEPNSQLQFMSRLGWATPDQTAKAEVSLDGGKTWQMVWSQTGDDTPGEGSYQSRSVSLAPFASRQVNIRFVYDTTARYFSQTNLTPSLVGWLLDDLRVSAAEELMNPVIRDVTTGTSFQFTPTTTGRYTLQVRAMVSNRYLAWGPPKPVTAQPGSNLAPTIRLAGIQVLDNNLVQIDFELSGGTAGQFDLECAPFPTGPFTKDNEAAILLTQPNLFRARTLTGNAPQRFYRVLAR